MLDAYSVHTITIIRVGHMEPWQEPGKERRVEVKARVERTDILVKTIKGEEVEAKISTVSGLKVKIGYQELKKKFNGDIDMYYDEKIEIDNIEYAISVITPAVDFSPKFWEVNLA